MNENIKKKLPIGIEIKSTEDFIILIKLGSLKNFYTIGVKLIFYEDVLGKSLNMSMLKSFLK